MLEFMGEGGDVPLLYMYRGMVLNILLLYAWALERKSLFNVCTRLWSNKQRCIRHQHCEVRPPGSEEPSAPSTTMVARSAPVPPPPRRGGAASALREEAGGLWDLLLPMIEHLPRRRRGIPCHLLSPPRRSAVEGSRGRSRVMPPLWPCRSARPVRTIIQARAPYPITCTYPRTVVGERKSPREDGADAGSDGECVARVLGAAYCRYGGYGTDTADCGRCRCGRLWIQGIYGECQDKEV